MHLSQPVVHLTQEAMTMGQLSVVPVAPGQLLLLGRLPLMGQQLVMGQFPLLGQQLPLG